MRRASFTAVMVGIGCVLGAGQAMAEGQCSKLYLGHDVEWREYDAVNETILVRNCRHAERFSVVDIKNSNPYPVCVTTKAEKAGRKWSGQPLKAGGFMHYTVENPDEVWRIGAKRMEGSYCK